MIGIHRTGAETCKVVLGHQEFSGGLDLAYDIAQGLHRAIEGGRGTVVMLPRHKLAIEWDGARLWLHVHSGTAPTHWFSTFPREELASWCAHFLHLTNLDTWDAESIPKARGHLIPMKLAAPTQPAGPYAKAWSLLRYFGYAEAGTKPPSFEVIAGRCSRSGLVQKRLRLIGEPELGDDEIDPAT